jgi:tetratricopeptide (TPR) repeat protein
MGAVEQARQLLREVDPLALDQRWDEALPRLEQAVALLDGGPDALSLAEALGQLGMVRSQAGQADAALEPLARSAAAFARLGITGREAQIWLVIGMNHAGRTGAEAAAAAAEALQRAVALTEDATLDPVRSTALALLGRALLYADQLAEAHDHLTRALAAAPSAVHQGMARVDLGIAELSIGRLGPARQHFAATVAGPDPRALWGQASAELERGELELAERGFRQLLERSAEASLRQAAHFGLAEVHLAAHRLPAAAAAIGDALAAGAPPEQALGFEARLAYAEGRREPAVAAFERWAAASERHRALALAGAAVALVELGQRDAADARAAEADALVDGRDLPGPRAHVRVRRGLVDLACGRREAARAALAEVSAYLDDNGIGPAAELAVWRYRLELALASAG